MNKKEAYLLHKRIMNTDNNDDFVDQIIDAFLINNDILNSEMYVDLFKIEISKCSKRSLILIDKGLEVGLLTKDNYKNIFNFVIEQHPPEDLNKMINLKEICEKICTHKFVDLNEFSFLLKIIKHNKFWLFSVIDEERKNQLSSANIATSLAMIFSSPEQFAENGGEIIDFIISKFDPEFIDENLSGAVFLFSQNNEIPISLEKKLKDIKEKIINHTLSNKCPSFFNHVKNIIIKEKDKKSEDGIIKGDYLILINGVYEWFDKIFKDNDLEKHGKNNPEFYQNIYEEFNFFMLMNFIRKGNISVLFSENKFEMDIIDLMIERDDVVELTWAAYLLKNFYPESIVDDEIIYLKNNALERINHHFKQSKQGKSSNYLRLENGESFIIEHNEIEKLKTVFTKTKGDRESESKREIEFSILKICEISFEKGFVNEFSQEILKKIEFDKSLSCLLAESIVYFLNKNLSKDFSEKTAIELLSFVEIEWIFSGCMTEIMKCIFSKKQIWDMKEKQKVMDDIIFYNKKSKSRFKINPEFKDIMIRTVVEKKFNDMKIAYYQNQMKKTEKDYVFSNLLNNLGGFIFNEKEDEKNQDDDNKEVEKSYFLYDEKRLSDYLKKMDEFKDKENESLNWVNKLKETTGERKLITTKNMLNNIEQLRKNFPNFEKFIDIIENNLYLNKMGSNEFFIPPSLLVGKPGIGKTFFLDTLANYAGSSYNLLSMESVSAGWVLTGMNPTWANASPGLIFSTAFESKYANNIMILDEIDKCGSGRYSVENVFLPLLERDTAMNFKDEYVPINIDISRMIWVATANDLKNVSAPIKSRFEVVEIPFPDFEERKIMTQAVYQKILNQNEWGKNFSPVLSDVILDVLCENENSNRDIRKNISKALGKASKRFNSTNCIELKIEDLDVGIISKRDDWDLKII